MLSILFEETKEWRGTVVLLNCFFFFKFLFAFLCHLHVCSSEVSSWWKINICFFQIMDQRRRICGKTVVVNIYNCLLVSTFKTLHKLETICMHGRDLSTNPEKEIGRPRTMKANNILQWMQAASSCRPDAATPVWRLQLDSTMDANEKKIIIEAVAFQVVCGRIGTPMKYSVSYTELADCNNIRSQDMKWHNP